MVARYSLCREALVLVTVTGTYPKASQRRSSTLGNSLNDELSRDVAHVMRKRALDGYGMDVCRASLS